MLEPASVLRAFMIGWPALFAGIVIYRLLTGAISTAGLLRPDPTGPVAPERVQMLLGSIAGAAYYALLSLQLVDGAKITSLPDVPEAALTLITGSQVLYLAGKVTRRIT